MALTVKTIEALKPRERPFKVADSGGLHLLVSPTGARLWRWKYRIGGREKQLAFGQFPEISLAVARELRDDAKRALRDGRDPGERNQRNVTGVLAPTFESVAREWHAQNTPVWTERHAADVIGSLQRLAFPSLGNRAIAEIAPPEVLGVLRHVEQNHGGETARRVRQRMSATFVHAIASGLTQTDPAAIVAPALAPVIKGKQPAIVDLDELRTMLRRAEAEPAHPVTKLALRFLSLTVVRPGELRGARWDEVEGLDSADPIWRIASERMKMRVEHVVPLPQAAVEVLHAIRPLTIRSPFIFPNSRWHHREMSENAVGYLLNRAGYHHRHCAHGFRAAFSSVMNERHPDAADAIERTLAHAPREKVRGTYNRASYLERRRQLLGTWADLLLAGAPDAATLRRPAAVMHVLRH